MLSHSFHSWQHDENPLRGGGRFVFFDRSGGSESGSRPQTPTTASTAQTGNSGTARPRHPQQEGQEGIDSGEQLTTEQLNLRRNARFVRKLEQLAGRGAIDVNAAKEAEKMLKSNDVQREGLARLLADRRINSNIFFTGFGALTSESNAKKGLARRLIRSHIDGDHFLDAFADIEGDDSYAKPLAQRLGLGRINQDEYLVARQNLTSPDVDQQRTAQQFALGHLTPQQFRVEMGMTQERQEVQVEQTVDDPVGHVQKEIHAQILEVLADLNLLMEKLPEQEKTQPIRRLQRAIEDIAREDLGNRNALAKVLRDRREEGKLTNESMEFILGFDADATGNFRELEQHLTSQTRLNNGEAGNLMTLKRAEWDIEQKFLKKMEAEQQIMEVAFNLVQYEALKQMSINNASEMAGIPIKEGTQIEYVYPNDLQGNVGTVTIRKVDPKPAPLLDKNGRVIGKIPGNIEIHLSDGQKMTVGQFIKWVNAMDAYEVIHTQPELEKALGLPQLGMSLKTGQALEYRTGYRKDAQGNIIPVRDTVQIRGMDNDHIQLSKPVVTLAKEEDPHARLIDDRRAAEMNLGEFAKWARRHDVVPPVHDLEGLRNILRQYNTYNNQTRHSDRNSDNFPPIEVKPGEWLQMGGGAPENRFQIQDADDNRVKFVGGREMTLPEFIDWVRKNEVERSNPEDIGNREEAAQERLGSSPSEAAAKKEAVKSIWQRFSTADSEPYKIGKYKPYGIMTELWNQYTLMSMMDIINFGKEIIEFIKRKHARRSKMRYSTLGEKLPGTLGTEFEKVKQAAENEEVNQYKEAMTQWGTWQVLSKLHETSDRDEAKACFITLTEKGEFRWDDIKMFKTLNRLTSKYTGKGALLWIEPTLEPRPLVTNPKVKVSPQDQTKDSMDALWGEGQWAGWFSDNISKYNSKKSAYEYKGKQLEADPKGTGGLTAELSRLLSDWKAGKYVNPHEYEELIDFGIKYGKMRAEDKLFFLFEGVIARCPTGPMAGMTLLHIDRLGDLDGQYLNQFPMLDFFTNKGEKPFYPPYLQGKKDLSETEHGYQSEELQIFADEYFKEDSKANKSGKNFSRFLWEWMIVDPNFRKRLAKGLRRAENMDHDDAHMYIPPATLEQIETFTGAYSGNQKYFTDEGYKNGYVGFNQYIVSLSNRYEDLEAKSSDPTIKNKEKVKELTDQTAQQLLDGVLSYYMYDSILDGRRDQRRQDKARLGAAQYRDTAVNDGSCTIGFHQTQMNNLVKAICEEYDIDWEAKKLFTKIDYGARGEQETIKNNMEKFLREELPKKAKADGCRGLLKVVAARKHRDPNDVNALRGIVGSNRLVDTGGKTSSTQD